MKFAASYSGGKESALSIYRAVKQGHQPLVLITTFNVDANRSHFHGISEDVLESVSKALDIPLMLVKTSGEEYAKNFEKALREAKELGAEACVFGDIDIEGHREWCSERCKNAGIEPMFPLWGESREKIVHEVVDSGFVANITIVNTTYLNTNFLGLKLTKNTAAHIASRGADICGENGEYHTFVSDGPIFKHPIKFSFAEKAVNGDYAMMSVKKEDGTKAHKSKYIACPLLCENKEDHICDFALQIDEIASTAGLLRSMTTEEELKEELRFVCDIIYSLSPSLRRGIVVTEDEFGQLEAAALRLKEEAAPTGTIVLPMGSQRASLAHVLRVKCKAAVRLLCKHGQKGHEVDGLLLDFAHLLSGYFYYLAFKFNALDGVAEIAYKIRD